MGFGSGGNGGFGNLRNTRKCESVRPCKGPEQNYPVMVKVRSNGRLLQVNASKTCNQFCARAVQDMVVAVMNEFPFQNIRYDAQEVRITATTNRQNYTTTSERNVEDYIRNNLSHNTPIHLLIQAKKTNMTSQHSSIFREWWHMDGNGGSEVSFVIEMGYKNQFN